MTDSRKTPRVSAIITTYNEEEFIRTAVESILEQTISDFEIVVVDDGSKDSTKNILKEYERLDKMRIFFLEHIGRSPALNEAIDRSRGKYIAIVDPDDLSRNNRFKRQADFLDNNPDVGIVGSAYRAENEIRSESYVREYPTSDTEIRRAMAKYIPIPHSSMMARREALVRAGLYDSTKQFIVDLDLMIRVATQYKMANIPEPLITRKIRSESSFHSMFSSFDRQLQLFKLNNKAVRILDLPTYRYLYSFGHLLYHYLPNRIKKWTRQLFSGLDEKHK